MNKNRILAVLFGTLLLDMVGIGMLIPIIPIIFTDVSSPHFLLNGYSVGAQYFIAGLITALAGVMQFVAAPILGELSDAYGRKRLLMLGVGALALSQMMFGFGIALASLSILLVSRIAAGLAGANFSIAQAAVADVTEPKDRAKNFGLIGAAFGLGFIVGPLLGGWIAGVTGNPASPFFLAGMLGVVNVLFVALSMPETNRARKAMQSFTLWRGVANIRAASRDVDARPVYLTSFLYMCGFTFFTSFVGILLVQAFGLTEVGVGVFFSVVGIWVVLAQVGAIPLVARVFKERQILTFSLPALAATIAVYPFLPNTTALYVVMPFMAVAQALSMANVSSLISRSVSESKQGVALGINSSLIALSQGVVPLLAGFFSGIIGITVPFVIGALVVLSSWWVLIVSAKR